MRRDGMRWRLAALVFSVGLMCVGSVAVAAEGGAADKVTPGAIGKTGDGFRVHVVNGASRYEAAGVLDVNKDGNLDIYCGGFWYEGPSWKKHFVREVPEADEYFYDFANLPMDVDGDGWVDIVDVAWHDKRVFWVRNLGADADYKFAEYDVDRPGNMETAIAVDINGDGQLDILPNAVNVTVWYEFKADASKPGGASWERHDLPNNGTDHGNGAGDVNGDGLCDVVTPKGWLEQSKGQTKWIWHGEFALGDRPAVPILVKDVDEDGDSDIVWGLGHGYGIYWLEQSKNEDGKRVWRTHLIDDSWSQPHYLLWADLDGNGADELVTGKRHRAHNGHDPGGTDGVCVYAYSFDKAKKEWSRRLISEGGGVGFGISTMARDLDGDGDIDLVAPGKSGLYWIENLLK